MKKNSLKRNSLKKKKQLSLSLWIATVKGGAVLVYF
jgi:hypothetical protein